MTLDFLTTFFRDSTTLQFPKQNEAGNLFPRRTPGPDKGDEIEQQKQNTLYKDVGAFHRNSMGCADCRFISNRQL
jgi:hypothetical protein